MKSESSVQEELTFIQRVTTIQNVAEIVVFVLWLTATIISIVIGTEYWQSIFKVASLGLLGTSIFNVVAMIGFSISGRRRFSVYRFIFRITLGAIAVLGLVISLFTLGIKIQ